MRWKLLVIITLVAAVAGFGVSLGLTLWVVRGGARFDFSNPAIIAAALIMPVAALVGGIFVYRHTARRRKLQACLTAGLILLLQICGHLNLPLLLRLLGR